MQAGAEGSKGAPQVWPAEPLMISSAVVEDRAEGSRGEGAAGEQGNAGGCTGKRGRKRMEVRSTEGETRGEGATVRAGEGTGGMRVQEGAKRGAKA